VVVAAGDSQQAQALTGKTVGRVTPSLLRACASVHCASLRPTPHAAASSFVNPLTALGKHEAMRMEGHTALVHTAATSSLGVMLNKACIFYGR
jgi:hypothetical protein